VTTLGKAIITTGIAIFTLSCLAWIVTQNWQWFAGGAAIFFGSVLTSAVVSVETKNQNSRIPNFPTNHSPSHSPSTRNEDDDDWQRPSTPPPNTTPTTTPPRDPFSEV
jgi:hypothetical protein